MKKLLIFTFLSLAPLIVHAQINEDLVAERDNDRPTLYYFNKRNVDYDRNEYGSGYQRNFNKSGDEDYTHSPYFSPYFDDNDGAPYYRRTPPINR